MRFYGIRGNSQGRNVCRQLGLADKHYEKTKMNRLLFIFSLFVAITAFGRKKPLGKILYEGNWSSVIVIENDKFYCLDPFDGHWINITDTLAVCDITWVNDSIIELNSSPEYQLANQKVDLSAEYDKSIGNVTKVEFDIPGLIIKPTITIHADNGQRYVIKYEKSRNIMLPDSIRSFYYVVRRRAVEEGYQYYQSPTVSVTEGHNYLRIGMPTITDAYFDRYNVKGEYAIITKRYFKWRGYSGKKMSRKDAEYWLKKVGKYADSSFLSLP